MTSQLEGKLLVRRINEAVSGTRVWTRNVWPARFIGRRLIGSARLSRELEQRVARCPSVEIEPAKRPAGKRVLKGRRRQVEKSRTQKRRRLSHQPRYRSWKRSTLDVASSSPYLWRRRNQAIVDVATITSTEVDEISRLPRGHLVN